MAPLHRSTPAPAPQPDNQLQIQHFTHQHLLQKLFMGSQFNCDGCKTNGFGLRYRCPACDFDLHEQCATSPHRISSHLHHHQLLLVNRPGNSHFCDVCKGFTDGLSYTCHSHTCEFDLHPLCTQIPVATGIPSNPSQQHPPMPASGGYNSQPVMLKQQQQQGIATTSFGGYNNQPVQVINGMPRASFGGYNNQSVMINNQYQQQKQGMHTAAFGGYNGVNNNNNNQQVMINRQYHQQQQQQQQGVVFGGYNGVNNNNQPMMMNQQQQQQGRTNNYSKMGKFAANILMTSLIGVPLNFNSKN